MYFETKMVHFYREKGKKSLKILIVIFYLCQDTPIFLINYYIKGSNETDEKNICWKINKFVFFLSHKFNKKLLCLLHFSNAINWSKSVIPNWGTQAVCRGYAEF